MKYLFQLLLLIIVGNATASSSCTNSTKVSFYQEDGSLHVNYHVSAQVKQLELVANNKVSTAIEGVKGTQLTASDNQRVLLTTKDAGRFDIKLKPLGKYINATYTPYIDLGTAHGVHINSVLPFSILKDGQRHKIDHECATLSIQRADQTQKIEMQDGFVLLNFTATSTQGSQPPVTYYINENMPAWIVSEIKGNVTKALRYYAAELGDLAFPVQIMMSFEDSEHPFFDGGVYANKLVIRFGGEAYKQFDQGAQRHLQQFVYHEIFHFWTKPQQSWIREGGADYAAAIAMLDVGLLDKQQFQSKRAEASATCFMKFGHGANFLAQGWRGRYACGLAVLSRFLPSKSDFFKYWKTLDKAGKNDLKVLSNVSQKQYPRLISQLNSQESASAALKTLLGPIQYQQLPSNFNGTSAIFVHLMAQHCQGVVSFHTNHNVVSLYNQEACSWPLEKLVYEVKALNGHPLSSKPVELLTSYISRCQSERKAVLSGETFKVELPCAW
ncbi:hypothetical protein ACSLBF_16725 [Pseudoalteromonas sp. T1lg65]|uniref:hypothetical protein n=1 Tax=Pseudoalteromonas sp. T1lg65 TaxID=2077101 RepID=UPI003F7A1565